MRCSERPECHPVQIGAHRVVLRHPFTSPETSALWDRPSVHLPADAPEADQPRGLIAACAW